MTAKRSISVPDDVAAWLDKQDNVSAAVTRAVRGQMNAARTEEMLRAAGFDITTAGKTRWRVEMQQHPITADLVEAADEMMRRAMPPTGE
jgi:5-enolpyruvylshikimate-3-phosphate synthase